jgi:hypothetical protein
MDSDIILIFILGISRLWAIYSVTWKISKPSSIRLVTHAFEQVSFHLTLPLLLGEALVKQTRMSEEMAMQLRGLAEATIDLKGRVDSSTAAAASGGAGANGGAVRAPVNL